MGNHLAFDKLAAVVVQASSGQPLDRANELQYDEYDNDNNQNVNPITGARHPGTDVPTQKAEQPQDQKNDDDSPQHDISPLRMVGDTG